MRRNELRAHTTTWMNLKKMLSVRSHSQKASLSSISFEFLDQGNSERKKGDDSQKMGEWEDKGRHSKDTRFLFKVIKLF